MGSSGRFWVSSSCRGGPLQQQEGDRVDVPRAQQHKHSHTTAQEMAGVPVICPRKTVLTSPIIKLLVINKRRILLPSVLGTQRTELHRMRDALHHQSPGVLAEEWCCSSPEPPALPKVPGCANPSHQPGSQAANAPGAASSPCPRLQGAVCLWLGHRWGFYFFIPACCELACSQVGLGQENELV